MHDGPTDGWTDGLTDKASYRDAWTHLKIKVSLLMGFYVKMKIATINVCSTILIFTPIDRADTFYYQIKLDKGSRWKYVIRILIYI